MRALKKLKELKKLPWYLIMIIAAAGMGLIYILFTYLIGLTLFRRAAWRKNVEKIELQDYTDPDSAWPRFVEYIMKNKEEISSIDYEPLELAAADGIKLRARFYSVPGSDKVLIGCHSFSSCGEWDFGQILRFWISEGFNVLLPDLRGHGVSEGDFLGYGILDGDDTALWVEYINERFADNCQILLSGTSLGGGTVMMMADRKDLKNVRGIISDSGIPNIYHVYIDMMRRRRFYLSLPAKWMDWLFRKKLGYSIRGKCSFETLKKTVLPVLLFHGTDDSMVNYDFAVKEAGIDPGRIRLVSFEGSDHTMGHMNEPEKYEMALKDFILQTIRC